MPPMLDIREVLPDSALCSAAIEYARASSPPALFHHVMRSAMLAELMGQRRKLAYDREVLCVATVLHDLGLTQLAPAESRFEIEGADFAKEFASQRGMSDRRVELVWDAIALHTTVQIPLRKSHEIALCHLGIAADLGIVPEGLLEAEALDEVLSAYPWLDIGESLLDTLVGLYAKNPKAAASGAVADACERRVPGFQRFNLCDHLIEKNAHRLAHANAARAARD